MNFNLTKEQIFFKEQVHRTLREIILPHAAAIDREDRFPKELFGKLGKLGYFGIRYPQEIGGMVEG